MMPIQHPVCYLSEKQTAQLYGLLIFLSIENHTRV